MMPLIYANAGETQIIKRIGGTPEVKKHLEAWASMWVPK